MKCLAVLLLSVMHCILLLTLGLLSPHVWAEESLAKDQNNDQEKLTLPEAIAEVKSENKSGMSWLWEEQLKPTIEHAGDAESLWIMLATAAATSYAHQYDAKVKENYGDNKQLSTTDARYGSVIGSGLPGILIAASQVYFDTENGLQHARALGFTAVSHFSIALATQRTRPNGKNMSFPSGHTSSSFATAASLAYDYGPWVGVPSLLVASYIAASRVANNAHWVSDTVAGAGLGIFWARASEQVRISGNQKTSYYPLYIPSEEGAMLGFGLERRF